MATSEMEIWTKIASEILTAVAAIIAAIQYRRNVRTRRAEWLLSLFERFYERPTYQDIRRILDSPPEPSQQFKRLEADLRIGSDGPYVEAFINYLNFFEFVAVLWNRGQLKQDEVCELFDYYLRNLRSVSFAHQYIRTQGFERLTSLLDKMEK